MLVEKGSEKKALTEKELQNLCREALEKKNFEGKRVLAIIPDTTRTGPVSLFFRTVCEALLGKVEKLDFMIALGTHPPMDEEKINTHLGITAEERKSTYARVSIFNHHWDREKELEYIGTIEKKELRELSGGLMEEDIPIHINRRLFNYDEILIIGPVFPHEVVGFSGGYKYLFPGVAGPQIIHRFHWLGALITNPKINGTKDTPVREVINKAASFIDTPITQLCFVVRGEQVFGFYAGEVDAWEKATELSSQVNIRYVNRTFHTVLAVAPRMYEELWTAGKCMYKLEPVVEDGGTLIIYAPHIKEVSLTHGRYIEEVGYHTRDYFIEQMDRFQNIPGAILAHSSHVKGIGTYKEGREVPRVNVILATGMSKEKCQKINLGYMNPADVNIEDYAGREDEGILLVRKAGEVLYRLSSGEVPDIDKLK